MSFKPVPIPGRFGFGTMSMTWTPKPVPFEDGFKSIKHSADVHDMRFINGADFYGANDLNLKLISEFWNKYGADYPDLLVSIKGGLNKETLAPDGSKESIKSSIDNIVSYFPKEKSKRPKLIFEVARVDLNTPYDETVGYIAEYVKSGAIDGLSLSEVGVGSIEKATSVFPVSCVEVEFSLLCQDILDNGVLKTASEKGIPIVAYSPIMRGFLTDQTANDPDAFFKLITRPGDFRGTIDRFSEENFPKNVKILKKLQEFAKSKNISLEALAISWILGVSELTDYQGIPKVSKIVPIPSGSTAEKVDKTLGKVIKLSKKDLDDIKAITDSNKPVGARYNAHLEAYNFA